MPLHQQYATSNMIEVCMHLKILMDYLQNNFRHFQNYFESSCHSSKCAPFSVLIQSNAQRVSFSDTKELKITSRLVSLGLSPTCKNNQNCAAASPQVCANKCRRRGLKMTYTIENILPSLLQ